MAKNTIEIQSSEYLIFLIGRLILGWNEVDELIDSMLDVFLQTAGISPSTAEVWSNDIRTEVLFGYILTNEKNENFKSFILNTKKQLLVCRENRNFLAHGQFVKTAKNFYFHMKRITRKRKSRSVYKLHHNHLIEVSYQIAATIAAINFISKNIWIIRQSPSHPKKRLSPLPKIRFLQRRIWENPPLTLEEMKLPPRSSRA